MPRAIRKKMADEPVQNSTTGIEFRGFQWKRLAFRGHDLQMVVSVRQGVCPGFHFRPPSVHNLRGQCLWHCTCARNLNAGKENCSLSPCIPGDCKSAARTPALGQGLFFHCLGGVSGPYYDQRAVIAKTDQTVGGETAYQIELSTFCMHPPGLRQPAFISPISR